MKFNIKTALESFTDEKGNSPLSTGTSLLTFGKTIPFQIAKSAILAVLLFIGLLGLLIYLDAPIFLIVLASIGGFCGMIAMGVTGVLKFITDAFFGNVTDMISSLLHPIDKVYDDFKKDTRDPNISKKDFFGHVLKDVVKPKVNDAIGNVPFGSKISSRFDELVDDIIKDKEFAASTSDDNVAATNFSQPIKSAIQKSTKKINTPFRAVLRWVLISWGGIFLVLLVFKLV